MNTVVNSKFLSLVLQHHPEKIGLELDKDGWTSVADLIAKAGAHGVSASVDEVRAIVLGSDKQRFALSDDGLRIRATQKPAAKVDPALKSGNPPETLYFGTIVSFAKSIRRGGIVRGTRQHVHLSPDRKSAKAVGARRGRPVVLEIKARMMAKEGHQFFRSAKGDWLTEHVPASFVVFPPRQA